MCLLVKNVVPSDCWYKPSPLCSVHWTVDWRKEFSDIVHRRLAWRTGLEEGGMTWELIEGQKKSKEVVARLSRRGLAGSHLVRNLSYSFWATVSFCLKTSDYTILTFNCVNVCENLAWTCLNYQQFTICSNNIELCFL